MRSKLSRILYCAGFGLLLSQSAMSQAGLLSEGDRQALLEQLEALKEGAGGRASSRAENALVAFRGAVGSDERAHELYLNCVEKVRFEDQKRSSQDFREWKRRHKEREDSPGFRRVLRHQLNWLLITIEANSTEEGKSAELSAKAVKALDTILGDEELESPQFRTLEQDVTKTVFAIAYGIEGGEKWPASPMKLRNIYQKHVLPPLEAKKDVAAFRSAWGKWIQQEANLQEARSRAPQKGERSAAYERFLVERRPQMLWELEQTVFKIGDQKGAALAMLEHLKNFSGHKNEVQWTKDFFELLTPQEAPVE